MVVDATLLVVFRIDPVTGDRMVLSGFGTGGGPDFVTPFAVTIDADGVVILVDSGLQAVVRVRCDNR